MRQIDLPQPPVTAIAIQSVTGGGALATAIDGQHCAIVEGSRQAGAGLMRTVMLDKMPAVRAIGACAGKALAQMMRRAAGQLARCIHHIAKPQRFPWRRCAAHRRLQRQRDRCSVMRQLQPRVVRIGDMIDLSEQHAGRAQAIVDRMKGQLPCGEGHRPLAMLDAREALFLGRRQYDAVAHRAGRAVMEGRIDSEGQHRHGSSTFMPATVQSPCHGAGTKFAPVCACSHR